MDEKFLEEFRSLKKFLIALGTFFAAVLLFGLVSPVIHVLIMLYTGILFAVFLSGLARHLKSKMDLTYRSAVVTVIISLLLLSTLGGWFMGTQVIKEFSLITEKIPVAETVIQETLRKHDWGGALLSLSNETSKLWSLSSGLLGNLTGFFSETIGVAVSLAFVFVAGIYLAISPGIYVKGFLKLFPISRRDKVREVLTSIGEALRMWLIGRTAIMAGVGVLTGVGYIIAGVPSSLALGLLAGFLAFVPFLGPIVAVIPAFLVALIEGPVLIIPVAIIFVVVHSVEGYLVTPLIQQRTVSLPPVVLLTAQVIIGLLFGVPGVIIATPLTITVIVVVQKIYMEEYLGDSVQVLGQGS